MSCSICSAPALPLEGACVFCRSPLAGAEQAAGLLDYLAARLPEARTRRGLLRRGKVREFRVEAAGTLFRARLRGDRLQLEPPLEPAGWVEAMLTGLSRRATGDPELRAAISRSGWSLR